jgi:thioredoxin-like negative regulator of GroEL
MTNNKYYLKNIYLNKMETFDKYVMYGEVADFTENGNLKNSNGYPTIVMIAAPWCGHCKTLKPIFGDCASRLKDKVRWVTLQESGEQPSNSQACEMLGKIIKLRGFPTMVKFDVNGNRLGEYEGQRSVDAIAQWALS